MKTMKYSVALFFLCLCSQVAQANEDTIIDPELMNKGVWAEPYFRSPGETPRETASSEAIATAATNEKLPEQYLDVLEKIPGSEPTVSRSWLEHKATSED